MKKLLLLFLLGSVYSLHTFSQTSSFPNRTIQLQEETSRYPVQFQQENLQVELCGLQVGMSYSLQLSSGTSEDCRFSLSKPEGKKLVYQLLELRLLK